MTVAEKIVKLASLIESKYEKRGEMHPKLAAQFQVEGFVAGVLRGQEKYADQLLDEEIAAELKVAAL